MAPSGPTSASSAWCALSVRTVRAFADRGTPRRIAIRPRNRRPCAPVTGGAHDGEDLLDLRRIRPARLGASSAVAAAARRQARDPQPMTEPEDLQTLHGHPMPTRPRDFARVVSPAARPGARMPSGEVRGTWRFLRALAPCATRGTPDRRSRRGAGGCRARVEVAAPHLHPQRRPAPRCRSRRPAPAGGRRPADRDVIVTVRSAPAATRAAPACASAVRLRPGRRSPQ